MSAVHGVNALALAAAELRLRRQLLTPIVPTTVRVFLTRAQVHRLFPHLADRFPLEVRLGGADAEVIDLRHRLECWPMALEPRADGRRR